MSKRAIRTLTLLLVALLLGAVLAVGVLAEATVTTELTSVCAVISDGVDIRIDGTVSVADRAKDVRVRYTFYEKTTELAVTPDADGAFSFDVPVGPGQMYGDITVQLTVDGASVGEPRTTSVRSYCAALLADGSSSAALKNVASDVLRYGAATLTYVGDTEGAARLLDGLTLTGTAYTAPIDPSVSYEGDEFTAARVILSNRLNLVAEDAVGTRTEISDIRFLDTWKTQTFTDSDGAQLTYSVAAYIAAMDEDAQAGAAVRALYSLCLSLDAYVGHAYEYVSDAQTHTCVCANCGAVSVAPTAHSYTGTVERTQGEGACAETHIYGVCVCGAEQLQRRIGACQAHDYVGTLSNNVLTYTCSGCGVSYSVDTLRADTFASDSTVYTLSWPTTAYTNIYKNGQLHMIGAFNTASFTNNAYLQVQYTGAMADTKHLVIGFDLTMPAAGIPEASFGAQIKVGNAWTTGQMVYVDADGNIYLGDRIRQLGRLTAGVMTNVVIDMRLDEAGTTLTYTVYLDGKETGTATKSVIGSPTLSGSGNTYVQLNIPVNAYGDKEASSERGVILDNVYLANGLPTAFANNEIPLEATDHTYVYRNTGATHARYCTVCGDVDLSSVAVHTYDTVVRQEPLGSGSCANVAVYRACSLCGGEDGTPVIVASEQSSHEYEFKPELSTLTNTSAHNGGAHTAPYGELVYQCKSCEACYTVDVISDRSFDSNCPCGTLLLLRANDNVTATYQDGRLYLIGAMNTTNLENNVYIQMQYLSGPNVPVITDAKHLVFGFDIGMPAGGLPEGGADVNLKIGSWTGDPLLKLHADGEIWLGKDREEIGQLSTTRMTNVILDIRINEAGTAADYTVYLDGIYAGAYYNPVTQAVDFTDANSYIQLNVGRKDINVDQNRGIIYDNCFVGNSLPTFDPSIDELHAVHEYDNADVRVDGDNLIFTCTVCALTKTVPSIINYDDFGAVGDGVTDDSEAIRDAHELANQWNLPVTATAGKTYRIGAITTEIPVKTDVDWNGATILIDDSGIYYGDQALRQTWVFHVQGQRTSSVIVPAGLTLAKGQTNIGITFDRPCMLKITNDNDRIYVRNGSSGNANGGVPRHEYILVDVNGNVDSTTPIQYDYTEITSIERYEIDDEPITVGGGTLITRVPDPQAQAAARGEVYENQYVFYYRGVKVSRANATVADVVHRIEGEQMVGEDRDGDGTVTTGSSSSSVYNSDKPYGVPYHGFFFFENVYNATFRDSTLQGHQAFNFFTESGVRNEMGNYDLTGQGCVNWKLLNLTQYESDVQHSNAARNEVITNRTMYHGIMGSNFCRNTLMDGCRLDRFDSHQGMHNATITNSTLGFGILVIGGGQLYIENVDRLSGNTFITLRLDYNSMFDGDIVVKNSTAGDGMKYLIEGAWYEHYLGMPNYIARSVTVDGFSVQEKPFYVYNISNATDSSLSNATNPLFAPERVSVSNFEGKNSLHTNMVLCLYGQRKAFADTDISGDVRRPYATD